MSEMNPNANPALSTVDMSADRYKKVPIDKATSIKVSTIPIPPF